MISDLVDPLDKDIEEITPVEDGEEYTDENQGDSVLLVLLRGLKSGSESGVAPNQEDGQEKELWDHCFVGLFFFLVSLESVTLKVA